MIFIDSRVGSKEMLQYMPNGVAELTRLQFGDAMFLGNGPLGSPLHIGVELKTIADLLKCIIDGRFSGHQLPGLIRDYHTVYLILEGQYRPDPDTGVLQTRRGRDWATAEFGTKRWMYRDLDCFLTTLEIRAGVRIRRTYDRRESARVVYDLHHWWTDKTFEEHRSISMFDVSGEPVIAPLTLLRRIAAQLPGIGWLKSQRVEKHFDSIVAMILATPADWMSIDGIGKGISTRIVEEIHKQKRRWTPQ